MGFEDPNQFLPGKEVIQLQLSQEGFDNLIAYLSDSVVLGADGKAIVCGDALYGGGHFYDAKGSFSISYTCNAWISDALKKAGCKLSGRHSRASKLFADLRESLSAIK